MNWKDGLITLFIVVVVLWAISMAIAEEKRELPKAGKKDDQSLMAGLGWHHNGGDGQAALLVYRHPLAHKLSMYLAIDRARVEGFADRTELIMGIQIFPLAVPFYVLMGAGASKTSANTDSIVSAGFGYQWTLSPSWYIDTAAEVDMEFDGDTRWAGIIGIGKRF